MKKKINFVRIVILFVLVVILTFSCEKEGNFLDNRESKYLFELKSTDGNDTDTSDAKYIDPDVLIGKWYGSFYCDSLDNGVLDKLCNNILIEFSDGLYYSISIEKETGLKEFIIINEGNYSIKYRRIYFEPTNCYEQDNNGKISEILSGQRINYYKDEYSEGIQIDDINKDWYFYEKY